MRSRARSWPRTSMPAASAVAMAVLAGPGLPMSMIAPSFG